VRTAVAPQDSPVRVLMGASEAGADVAEALTGQDPEGSAAGSTGAAEPSAASGTLGTQNYTK